MEHYSGIWWLPPSRSLLPSRTVSPALSETLYRLFFSFLDRYLRLFFQTAQRERVRFADPAGTLSSCGPLPPRPGRRTHFHRFVVPGLYLARASRLASVFDTQRLSTPCHDRPPGEALIAERIAGTARPEARSSSSPASFFRSPFAGSPATSSGSNFGARSFFRRT